MPKEIFITIDKSKPWHNTKRLWDQIKDLSDGKYKITISKSSKRTLQQNDWLHAVLPAIRDALRDAGYNEIRSTEDAKDFIKTLFFSEEISNGVETMKIVRGTSETSKLDFASRAEDIIIWGQTYLGIDIAPPGKQFEFFE